MNIFGLFTRKERRHNYQHVECEECIWFDPDYNQCDELVLQDTTADMNFESCGEKRQV